MAFIIALISSMIVNNIILAGYKGLCSYIGLSNNWKSSVGMGAALTLVCFISGLICWGLQFALNALGIGYLQTVVFILVIASLVQMLEIVMKKFLPGLYKALGIYLPLITTNCVVLGLALAVSGYTSGSDWATVLGTCLGMPLGYYLVLIIFSAIQERLALATPNRAFKGAALSFICTAFMALAVVGFTGLIG
jgi:electron transport complex protein RnfA